MGRMNKGIKGTLYATYKNEKVLERIANELDDFHNQIEEDFGNNFKFQVVEGEVSNKDCILVDFNIIGMTFTDVKADLVLFKKVFKERFGISLKEYFKATYDRIM